MALVSARPRSASATVSGQADVLEVSGKSLAALADEMAPVAKALSLFTEQRVLHHLLRHNHLFRPFDAAQREQLLKRFTRHEINQGDRVISEGEPGHGLFVIVAGEFSVTKEVDQESTEVASLGPGQIFGEIALMRENLTVATVTAVTPGVLLFLGRDVVARLVEALPELREYLAALAEDRALETQLSTSSSPQGDDDVIILI